MSHPGCTEQKHASHPVARAIQFARPAAMGVDGATNDRMLSDNGINEGNFLLQSGSRYIEELLNDDADINEVDSQCMQMPSRIGLSTDGDAEGRKADGLQELLQLAEEYESEEAAKRRLSRKECHVCGSAVLEDKLKECGLLDTTKSAEKEDTCHKTPGQRLRVSNSKWPDLKKVVPHVSKGQVPTSSSAPLSLSKAAVKTCRKVQTEGNVHKGNIADYGETNESVNRNRMDAVSQKLITNCTIPRPFSLATDKRACNGGRLADGENKSQTQKVHPLNSTVGNLSLKNTQVSKKTGSKAHGEKIAHSESVKHQEDTLEKLIIHSEPKQAKDDMISVSSVQSGPKTPTTKASIVTRASGFNFRCQERSEKRKEFYARLDERLNAKEEEKNRMQEKTKEQNEEELRMLRRSLTYKAHPMPSFYTEGHPAKAELKKIPPTRARSPKFTRRNSHPGCEKGCSRVCKFMHYDEHYIPNSPQKSAERNTDKFGGKNNNGYTRKLVKSLSKELPVQLAESKSAKEINCPTPDVESIDVEVVAVNGSIDELDVKMSPISSLSPEDEIDEEKYGGHGAWDDKFSNPAEMEHLCLENSKLTDLKQTPVLAVPCERSKFNDPNDLQTGPASGTGLSVFNSDKLKPAIDSSHDLTVKGSRTTKRERLKELTPYFRKQDSSQNLKQSAADLDMVTMLTDITKGT